MISMMSRNQTKEKRTKKHCFNIYIMCSVKVIILYVYNDVNDDARQYAWDRASHIYYVS